MKILAFESSTKLGSVALIQDGVCTHLKKSELQKSHSEVFHQFVFEILTEAGIKINALDGFAAGCGPGSFTGIRVSINTAKGFAYAFQKPMVVIDSLQNLAHLNQSLVSFSKKILCLINAYKNMSYYAIFSLDIKNKTKVLHEPQVIQMKNIKTLLNEPILVVGDGFLTYKPFLPEEILLKMIRPDDVIDNPTADCLGILAYEKFQHGLTLGWKSIKPLYIRASEAEENKRGIVWSPLDFKE